VKPEILTRYFTKSGDVYQVKPEVRSLVKFSYMNLNDPRRTSAVLNVDVIFCRNVMIYFSDAAKKELVRRYYNALRPGGYFYIGHSETLHGVSKAFKLVYFKNALVYQKDAVATGTGSSPAISMGVQASRLPESRPTGTDGKNRAVELLKHIKPVGVSEKREETLVDRYRKT
jgi:SAM-dependent methyltransferase